MWLHSFDTKASLRLHNWINLAGSPHKWRSARVAARHNFSKVRTTCFHIVHVVGRWLLRILWEFAYILHSVGRQPFSCVCCLCVCVCVSVRAFVLAHLTLTCTFIYVPRKSMYRAHMHARARAHAYIRVYIPTRMNTHDHHRAFWCNRSLFKCR